MNTERLMAFSDGVFAIAITLLILEIKIPKHHDLEEAGGLYAYLFKIWPSYLSYVVSFFVIGVYWSNHHWLFTFVKKTDHKLNMLHLFFLMGICFLPFSTAIMGDYIMDEHYQNAAVSAYCLSLLLPLLPLIPLCLYATHKNRLVDDNLNRGFINRLTVKLFTGFVIQFIAYLLSFNYPMVALGVISLSTMSYFLPPESPVYDE